LAAAEFRFTKSRAVRATVIWRGRTGGAHKAKSTLTGQNADPPIPSRKRVNSVTKTPVLIELPDFGFRHRFNPNNNQEPQHAITP
jgi:hypothetical protein